MEDGCEVREGGEDGEGEEESVELGVSGCVFGGEAGDVGFLL